MLYIVSYCIVLYCIVLLYRPFCNLSAIFLVNGTRFGLENQTKPRTQNIKKIKRLVNDKGWKIEKKHKRKRFAEKKLLVWFLFNDKVWPKANPCR